MSAASDNLEAVISALETECIEERICPLTSRKLAATLDFDVPHTADGDEVLPLAHWLYCLPIVAHAGLDENGHPRRGRNMPDLPFFKRMFAGSDIQFVAPMRAGAQVRRTGKVTSILPKQGRSGAFYLVNVRQEYSDDEGLLIIEDQKIVYRKEVSHGKREEGAQQRELPAAEWSKTYLPDERMLFRYSALLFSAHRIHFDREFTLSEGYPALVVHGQLAATCLAQLAVQKAGRPLKSFSYRSTAPLFEKRPFLACGRPNDTGAELWALDDAGGLSIRVSAEFRTGVS